MPRLVREVHCRDPLLSVVGWVHVALAALFLLGLAVDPRTVLGINPWVKPLKFALSITIYVWTIAWLLDDVRAAAPRATRLISRVVALAMIAEIVGIAAQSVRGVPSHFNNATSFDQAVFALMGLFILTNTLMAVLLLVLYFRHPTRLPRPQLWGIRLGLIVFLLGSSIGGMMVGHGGHAVGVRDGGPGLPLVNWSREAGDLRVAHALGLHALQVLPLLGWAVTRLRGLGERRQVALTVAFAALYALTTGLLLAQALVGRPLLA